MQVTRFKRFIAESRGQEIAEAAIVLPLLFMLLLGIYWFGRAFNIYGTINHAAREGARAAISNCASCGNTPASNGVVAGAVTQALQASRLDTSKVQCYTPAPPPAACPGFANPCTCDGTTNNVMICRSVQLNPAPGTSSATPACGVTVSFQYPYQFWFPFTSLNMQRISLKASVQSDGEQ